MVMHLLNISHFDLLLGAKPYLNVFYLASVFKSFLSNHFLHTVRLRDLHTIHMSNHCLNIVRLTDLHTIHMSNHCLNIVRLRDLNTIHTYYTNYKVFNFNVAANKEILTWYKMSVYYQFLLWSKAGIIVTPTCVYDVVVMFSDSCYMER